MITKPEFEIAIKDLQMHCKAQLDPQQIDIMWRKLGHLPANAIAWACQSFIEEVKQTKAAFPTISQIKNKASDWVKANPNTAGHKEYDPFDDFEYPMRFLHEAFRIITEVGPLAFNTYVETMRMPIHDRERVLNKARIAAKVGGLNDMITALEDMRHHGQTRKQNNKSD